MADDEWVDALRQMLADAVRRNDEVTARSVRRDLERVAGRDAEKETR